MNQLQTEQNIPLEKSPENRMYYIKKADKYGRIKWLTLFLTAIVLAAMLIFGGGSLRAVHFRYLVKYWDINPITLDSRYSDIAYSVGGGARFAFYEDELAVFGEGRLSLYDLSGESVFQANAPSGNLSADSEGRMLALFSPGGKTVGFYHSFAKEGELSFSYPVSDVCVSREGTVAVCLKNGDGAIIELYNDRLKIQRSLTMENGVVMDTAISEGGDTLCVLSLSGMGGSYFTKLSVWSVKSGEMIGAKIFGGKKPLAVGFFDDDGIYAVLDRAVVFLNEKGEIRKELSLSSEPSEYSANQDCLAILDRSGNVSLFDAAGETLFSASFSGAIDLKLSGDTVYLLSERSVSSYSVAGEQIGQAAVSGGVLDFFILDDNSILLCYTSGTKRIVGALASAE